MPASRGALILTMMHLVVNPLLLAFSNGDDAVLGYSVGARTYHRHHDYVDEPVVRLRQSSSISLPLFTLGTNSS